jgi:hypothetical protein
MAEALLAADHEILVLVMEKDASALRSALSLPGPRRSSRGRTPFVCRRRPPEGIVRALDGLGCSHPLIIRNSARTPGTLLLGRLRRGPQALGSQAGQQRRHLKRFGHLWIRNLGRNLGRNRRASGHPRPGRRLHGHAGPGRRGGSLPGPRPAAHGGHRPALPGHRRGHLRAFLQAAGVDPTSSSWPIPSTGTPGTWTASTPGDPS